jgi:hypothetical protein
MRTKIKSGYAFLFICLLITGCEKINITESGTSSIKADGTLKGVITPYNVDEIDSIKAFDPYNSIDLGEGKVLENGNFSIILSIPPLKKVSDGYKSLNSDLTASVGSLDSLLAYKNNRIIGYLVRSNYTNYTKDSIGMAFSSFIYCDKTNTYNGESEILSPDNSGGYYDKTYKSNFTLNKGWNEVSIILTNVEMNGLNHALTYSRSNYIPTNLKWKYIKKESGN